jgi:hypothetical protein
MIIGLFRKVAGGLTENSDKLLCAAIFVKKPTSLAMRHE